MLYRPDCEQECKDNVKEFLEFLHDGGGDEAAESQGLKDFVYHSIKAFAESNQKAYQTSNLIELMNKVVECRRGDIFDDVHQATASSHGFGEDKLATNASH